MSRVAVIGNTTWGTTLGIILARKGMGVRLWARTQEEAEELNRERQNRACLPGVAFPQRLQASSSLEEVMAGAALAILAVPAQTMRGNVRLLAGHLGGAPLLLSAAKGLEADTGKCMSQVIAEEIEPGLHPRICVLSGPNLAREIIRGLPAATVVAAEDEAVAQRVKKFLTTPTLCVYTNTDVVGGELGGALKNIIALGAGIADGLDYGDNAKAALMTRGLAEITALGVAMGANPHTFSGLAGWGDLIVTCASALSRNHYVGVELARGRSMAEITASMREVAEGIATTQAAREVARRLGVEMPITELMYRVLFEGLNIRQAAAELMGMKGGRELPWVSSTVPLSVDK
jgi:glycerol-3-phosphate dehydrogenase (NAD(P)+)